MTTLHHQKKSSQSMAKLKKIASFGLKSRVSRSPVEQDTETRDLWEYIQEWREKFGRIPKDEDELADCIDYVMKRQKPADKIEPKFKVGDWVINNDKRIAVPTQILEIEKYGYVTSRGYISFGKVKTDYHLLTIQDAKERFVQPNHWKPSKEQLEAIKYFIDFHRPQANASTEGWKEFKYLESLYNNIKRL